MEAFASSTGIEQIHATLATNRCNDTATATLSAARAAADWEMMPHTTGGGKTARQVLQMSGGLIGGTAGYPVWAHAQRSASIWWYELSKGGVSLSDSGFTTPALRRSRRPLGNSGSGRASPLGVDRPEPRIHTLYIPCVVALDLDVGPSGRQLAGSGLVTTRLGVSPTVCSTIARGLRNPLERLLT